MLIGRPIMEFLQISLDFAEKGIRFGRSGWQPATIGIHGEYLLSSRALIWICLPNSLFLNMLFPLMSKMEMLDWI